MIKLLALDMDGTLLNDRKELTKTQVDTIHQAVDAGVKLVLCTGRILNGIKPYFEQLGLDAENEYVIVNNGCSTHQTSDWSLVGWEELSIDDVASLLPFKENNGMQLTLFDEENYYVVDEEANDFVRADTELVFVEPVTLSSKEIINSDKHYFQAMFVGSLEETNAFQNRYDVELSQRFNTVRSQPIIYEILPKGVSKASALQKLAEKLGIEPSEIMAVGDADNDIEMLQFAGLPIAMENASDHVKSFAKDVTASNNHDGVAKAIQKWILNQ
ncbi:Cof-type HAD-IIB family hydrolase [Streptococcus sp. X16XC17]|uniref:Cof-type HAD-IIB family hydrolase n=1 Tax=unclassified Streptococcus TaxID=2608887 RepID=UPI00066FDB9D|nr:MULTISPECIES: Cof-type HAD-IIB family hydrolase [unclassified Streptococcus]TCD46434.1 Cof-type HAD-IIB family hydrolase [Streptococcus sp. X16XC17]